MAKRIKGLDENISVAEDRILKLNSKLKYNTSEEIPVKYVQDKLKSFNGLLSQADDSTKKMLMHLMIEEITVNKKRELDSIKIKYNEDVNTMMGSSKLDDPIFVFKIAI